MTPQLVHFDIGPGFRKAFASCGVPVYANGPMARLFGWRKVPVPAFLIVDVSPLGDVAKVAQAVVGFVMVDVVNNIRLLAVSKKPCDAVSVIPFAQVRVGYVSILQRVTDWLAGLPPRMGFKSVKQPGIRIVPDSIADRLRNWDCFHLASMPYRLQSSSITMEGKHGK
jgi:hypothetical protein